MARIQLIHWNAEEARSYLQLLAAAGHEVAYTAEFRPAVMQGWRESPPDAFVIDLSRLPSHGRELGGALRQSRATRHVPIVFCDGAEEKIARVRSELPDAVYCTQRTLRASLRRALKTGLETPVVPRDLGERYAGRSAAQKLGLKEGARVAAVDPPRDFPSLLGGIPNSVEFLEYPSEKIDIIICFIQNPETLQPRISQVRTAAKHAKLWLLWRKGGSAARGDVTEGLVRETALDLGLVDYKICSVNSVWSALAFARKR